MGSDPRPPEPEVPSEIDIQRVRSSPADTRLSLATGIVVLLVTLAILKPWGGLGVRPTGAPPLVTAAPIETPAPTATTPEGLAETVCLGAGAWQLASLETWRTQDVRVWRALEPVAAATGPLDPAIPIVPVIAIDVQAIGWCAPAVGPDKPAGPANVVAWEVANGDASELPLLQVRPARGTTPFAALYQPLGPCAPSAWCPAAFGSRVPRPWTAGRVIFGYVDEGTAREAWFGVDVELIPSPG